MPLDNGSTYIDADGVQVDQRYRGSAEAGRKGERRVSQDFLLRKKNNGLTVEMGHAEAYQALVKFIGTTRPNIGDLNCTKISIPQEQANYPTYNGSVEWEYQPWRAKFGSPPLWSHGMSAETITVQFPFAQQWFTKNGREPVPYNGVNWDNKKHDYEGVEIIKPGWNATAKVVYGASRVTPAYILSLQMLMATVNGAVFQGFDPGTVLYMGADLQQNGDISSYMLQDLGEEQESLYWDITHHFRMAPNLTNIDINGINVPFKAGHDVLWTTSSVKTPPEQSGVIKKLYGEVEQVNVAKVYADGDFSLLQLDIF